MQLVLRNVGKRFGKDTWAVRSVNLEVEEGEFFTLLGPSGCGKTTILRLVAGLEELTEGDIFLGSQRLNDIPPQKRDVAMVFQDYALYPNFTVFKNIGFNLKLRGVPNHEIKEKVRTLAWLLGIERLLERHPRELSGGERQRVALGRALVRDPKLFLLDEPLSNLDLKLREQTRIELHKIHSRMGKTTLFVTHDQGEAMTLSDRLAVFHQGRILQVGTPRTVYDRPSSVFVAKFVGSPTINLLHGVLKPDNTVEMGTAEGAPGRAFDLATVLAGRPINGSAPRDVLVGLRPEHFRVFGQEAPEALEVKVELVEDSGAQVYVLAEVPAQSGELFDGGRLVVLLDRDYRPAPGQRIWLQPRWEAATFYDPDTEASLENGID